MQYKTFKEFYWKNAIWRIGLPWGLITGILVAIARNKEVLSYFTSWPTLLLILFFIVGGFFFALTAGKSRWKRAKIEEDRNP